MLLITYSSVAVPVKGYHGNDRSAMLSKHQFRHNTFLFMALLRVSCATKRLKEPKAPTLAGWVGHSLRALGINRRSRGEGGFLGRPLPTSRSYIPFLLRISCRFSPAWMPGSLGPGTEAGCPRSVLQPEGKTRMYRRRGVGRPREPPSPRPRQAHFNHSGTPRFFTQCQQAHIQENHPHENPLTTWSARSRLEVRG